MAKETGVRVGQQYVNVHSTRNPPPVWEVKSIHPGDLGIDHAGLMNLDDSLHKKTVCFSALLDKTHYRLVSSVGAVQQVPRSERKSSRGTSSIKNMERSILHAPSTPP